MWTRAMFETDLYHIVHWFLVYSILGWFIESVYMSICNKKITNRGFVTGPFCPIYGIGALTVYFLLRRFSGDYLILYVLGCVIPTALEYITAQIMLGVFGEVWWDYHDKPYNYKGIICLESTIAWGLYTVILFKVLHRVVEAIVDSYSFGVGRVIGTLVLTAFTLDFLHSLYVAKKDVLPTSVGELKESIRGFYQRF